MAIVETDAGRTGGKGLAQKYLPARRSDLLHSANMLNTGANG